MKSIKRLTALLLALVMMFTLAPMAFAASDFSDVSKSDWFYAPVNWAVSKGITGGIGNNMFGPNNNCTREQVVTFLWADAGKPEPNATGSAFTDVKETDWFFKPVMWAVENGITSGLTATEFGTGKNCTRAQVATFLWAVAGKPSYDTPEKGFLDVGAKDWFYNPVMWAVANGITSGVSAGKFGPNNNCTRAQIATFMYAASPDYVKPAPTPVPTPAPTPVPTPAPITKDDRIEIAAAYVEDINSVDGVDIAIYWRNNTGKEINYIHFNCYALDLNGNIVKNDFYPYYYDLDCWLKGPITTDNKDMSGDDPCSSGLYYTGLSAGGKPNFSFLTYDEEMGADYYYSYEQNIYGEKIYIDPVNANRTYMGTHWEAIIYNARTSDIRIHSIKLEYADGTVETIKNPVVGSRTDPTKDYAYTQKLKDSLGCDVVGHDVNPTCLESDICKRCYKIFPATGHTYGYSAICNDCGFRYEPDVTLVKRNFPATIYENDRMGNEYSFRVKNVYFDPKEELDVNVYSGEIEVSGWIYCTFAYESAATNIFPDIKTVYVDFVDENGKVVHTESFVAGSRDTSEWFNVDFPGNGTYYVDVRYKEPTVQLCSKHTWGDDLVCDTCKTRRVPENNLADPLDYIEIGGAEVSSVGDNDEVNTAVYWRNNTGKTIKRIEFHKSILDKYGNVISCDVNNNTSENCYMEALVSADNTADKFDSDYYYYDNGFYTLYYNEEVDAYSYWEYFEEEDLYEELYVHPDNMKHTYIGVFWSDIMRNPDAAAVRVDKIVIQFNDGTTATYYEPKVAPRSDAEKDNSYTAELKERYGCDTFGHTYSDTNVCDRCGYEFIARLPEISGSLPAAETINGEHGTYRFEVTDVQLTEDAKAEWVVEGDRIYSVAELTVEYVFEEISGTIDGEKRTLFFNFINEDGEYVSDFVHVEEGKTSTTMYLYFSDGNNNYTYEIFVREYSPDFEYVS